MALGRVVRMVQESVQGMESYLGRQIQELWGQERVLAMVPQKEQVLEHQILGQEKEQEKEQLHDLNF
jgi:hypothetical protein